MQELIAGIHAHTTFSDGAGTHAELAQAAMKAGLDVLITTDHNVLVQGMDGYLQKGRRKMLLLAAEEIHDPPTRQPGGNHMLMLGANRELAKFASDPQELIKQAKSANGLSFIAHPPNDIALPPMPMKKPSPPGLTGKSAVLAALNYGTNSASSKTARPVA